MTTITQADRDAALVAKLRGLETYGYQSQLACEAADRIEALSAEVGRLRAALAFYADYDNPYPNDGPWGVDSNDFGYRARAALEATK